jgi:MFS family permease
MPALPSPATAPASVVLGLRANLGQFALLVAVNALVGGMVGQERTVVPLLASEVFFVPGVTAVLTFLVAFGVTKAGANLVAGALADRVGRKPVLVAGWLIGLPVPLLLIWAPAWGWVVVANVLLGVNQGLTWSTTVIMKIDLVGPVRRGLALGLNEAAGYGGVAVTALLTGLIAEEFGLRPAPFLLGLAYAAIGLGLSAVMVRETTEHVALEQATRAPADHVPWRDVLVRTTVRDRSLSAACQAGLVNNLNDAMAWGLLPLFFAAAGLSVGEIGVLAAAYPAVWAVAQIGTGAWSDRVGRKPLIVAGMLVQAIAIGVIAAGSSFSIWLVAAVGLGIGTALVYPTLLAAVADVAEPAWRGAAVGVYRLWRDLGFAVGAIVVGLVADAAGASSAIWAVAALTAGSGLLVAARMRETKPA